MDTRELVKGSVEAVTYRNKENGYTVIKLNTNGETLVATGVMPYIGEGEIVTLHGSYVVHSTYGKQFKCDLCEVTVPETGSQILKYLSGGAIKGIGPATALKIVEMFKEDTLDVIENHPTRLTAIKGISAEKAVDISEQYKAQFGMRDIMLTLSRFKITPVEAGRIFKVLGVQSMEIIKENPYALCTDGIDFSFERVEEIADSFDIKADNNYRVSAGIIYVLKSNLMNGHTCLPKDKLAVVSARLLGVDEDVVNDCIEAMLDSFVLFEYVIDSKNFIFLPEYAMAEESSAALLKSRLKNNNALFEVSPKELDFVQQRMGIEFDEKQIEAVCSAMSNSVFILTGGPGTGKTTTLNAIIDILENRNLSIALAAPTGRAAKRMTELTGREASTLHRLLEVEWGTDSKQTFSKNRKHPLDYDVVIVDEMSMVDTLLFKALLDACSDTTRLILVGDSEQLPSVGAGNVLGDLIGSGVVPFVRLDRIFRQSQESSIIAFAHDIILGNIPDNYERAGDFYFIKCRDIHSAVSTTIELATTRLAKAYGFSPTEDIQVLCPSRKKDCGTVNLNNLLQDELNPLKKNGVELHYKGNAFRVGDKVMHIKNDYDIIWDSDSGETGTGVYNGDIGYITEIDLKNRMLRVRYDDKIATYYEENLALIELAYAVTVHKSQGCEFPCAILPLFDTVSLLRYRNLLYTAITRAKQLIVLVGDTAVFEEMIENDRKTLRYTALKYFLYE